MSTGRGWLDHAIDQQYLPVIAKAKNTPAGRKKLTQFVQAMRDDWAQAHQLAKVIQQKSLMSAVRKAIKEQLGADHWSLDIVNFSTEEWIETNQATQAAVSQRNEQVQFIDDPQALVAIAARLLERSEWAEVAAGLSLLTGRRVAELLSTAQFEQKSQWSVVFSGAVKRGEHAQPFEIPTLVRSEKVIAALEKIRYELPQAVGLSPNTVNRRYEAAVIRACDKHFAGAIPLRAGKESLYTHLNRAVYATIATFWYCPPTVQEWEFKAHIQGHFQVLDAPNEPARRSLLSSRHYSDYEISDKAIAQQGGKRKGIKLGYMGIVPIEVFQAAWQRGSEPTPVVRVPKRKPTTIQIYKDTQARWKRVIQAINPDNEGTQLERTEALLQWMEQQLQAHSQPQLIPEPAIELQAQEMPLSAPAVDGSKADELRQLIAAIVSEQLLTHLPQPASQPQQRENTDDDASTTANAPSLQPSIAKTTQSPSQVTTAARGRKASAEVEARVNHAIDAIFAHNNALGRRHDDKWEITIRSLKTLGCAQTAIYRLWEQRKDEIEHHHQQHGIATGHNTRHRGKTTIEDIVRL